jgi:N-acetylmuramoyl-L-alanine amidase
VKTNQPPYRNLSGLLMAVLAALLLVGCGGTVDNGHAFLVQYASQWQATPVSGQSFPYATPGVAAKPNNGPGLSRPNGQASPNQTLQSGQLASSSQPVPRAKVFLDPGHGGVDEGTSGTTEDGTRINEKATALAVAMRTAEILRADGISVALSRQDDSLPGLPASAYTADGTLLTPDGVLADLQRRIDTANASGASVMLSIHFNGYSDPSVGGSETFYDATRTFGTDNQRFATLVQNSVITSFHAHGYAVPDRGITDDTDLQAEAFGTLPSSYNHLVVLGPELPGRLRPSNMPGALSESLFLSNPAEATIISQPAVQDLLAQSYADAIEAFLKGQSSP